MTNAEKYLKDEAKEEFIKRINEELDYAGGQFNIEKFLNEPCKPTLTEDERAILRNIDKKYTHIGRRAGIELYIKSKDGFKHCWCFYNHLFQFIKVRRRI